MAAKAILPLLPSKIPLHGRLFNPSSAAILNNIVQVRFKVYKYQAPYFKYDVGRKSYADMDVSTWDGEEFVEVVKHPEASREYPGLYSGAPPPIGRIYDRKPFKMEVEAGKVYLWCSCGNSKTQPFCDNTHLYDEGNSRVKTKPRFRPTKFIPKENKTVYFCNCKHTKNRPFCDNTHKEDIVLGGISTIRD